MEIKCQQCGGQMVKRTISSGNCLGLLVALTVLVVGITLIVAIPVIGWILGALLCLIALFIGGKRKKVWKCSRCGYFFERANESGYAVWIVAVIITIAGAWVISGISKRSAPVQVMPGQAVVRQKATTPRSEIVQAAPQKPSQRFLSVGEIGRLGFQGQNDAGSLGSVIWVCLNEASWNDMLVAENTAARGGPGDRSLRYQLAVADKIRCYGAGTKVKVIKSGPTSTKVEVLEGRFGEVEDQGDVGWVQTELVLPPFGPGEDSLRALHDANPKPPEPAGKPVKNHGDHNDYKSLSFHYHEVGEEEFFRTIQMDQKEKDYLFRYMKWQAKSGEKVVADETSAERVKRERQRTIDLRKERKR